MLAAWVSAREGEYRSNERVPVPMGGNRVHRAEDGLCASDAARLDQARRSQHLRSEGDVTIEVQNECNERAQEELRGTILPHAWPLLCSCASLRSLWPTRGRTCTAKIAGAGRTRKPWFSLKESGFGTIWSRLGLEVDLLEGAVRGG